MRCSGQGGDAPGDVDSISGRRAPRCLVLLASHNGAAYIQEQIESILSQREVAVEILVGDDASTDDTVAIIQKLNGNGKILALRRDVGSGSAAQNFARLFRETDVAGFDYVALSDQDDIWLPDKLARAIWEIARSGAGGYSCSVVARWPDGRESVLRQCARLRDADFLFEGAGQGCSFVITAQLFDSVQRIFRQRQDLAKHLIYHDWAVYAIARAQGAVWIFDAEPFVIYRQHGGNDTGTRYSLEGIRRRLRMFLDGRYAGQVFAISRICSEIAPQDALLRRWMILSSMAPSLSGRMGKIVYCARHGRRRSGDRIVTAVAAAVGWL